MIISLIVAMDLARGIGKNNGLPWHLSSDLKRFKALTMGHHILMGRKTFESIGRVLPGRTSIVMTRQSLVGQTVSLPNLPFDQAQQLYFTNSLEQALQIAEANAEQEAFVIGGGEIFRLALPVADRIYLTTIQARLDCDTFFPELNLADWQIITESDHPQSAHDQFASRYQILQRLYSNARLYSSARFTPPFQERAVPDP